MKQSKALFGEAPSTMEQTRKPGLIARRIKSNELKAKSKATKNQVRTSKLNLPGSIFKR